MVASRSVTAIQRREAKLAQALGVRQPVVFDCENGVIKVTPDEPKDPPTEENTKSVN